MAQTQRANNVFVANCCKRCEKTFQGEYVNNGAKPETKQLVLNMKVDNWKNGKSKPTTAELSLLAGYFNITADYLLGRTGNLFPPELHNVKLALYDSVSAGLDDADIDMLKQMAKRLRDKSNM